MHPLHSVRVETVDADRMICIEAGSHIEVSTRCACSAGCDLSGCNVVVTVGSSGIARHVLSGFDAASGKMNSNRILLAAPNAAGEWPSSIRFPAQQIDGLLHAESAMAFSVVTTAIKTTLAIWDVPQPVDAGRVFQVQAGLKSSRGLSMAGATIAVFAADNSLVCRTAVEDYPLEGTGALYRSTLDLVAPSSAGTFSWSVRSDVSRIAGPHDESSTDLCLLVVDPPQHRLLISLTDENGCGVGGTLLRLGPYRQTTGPDGSAEFLITGGSYLLRSWSPDYELLSRELDVNSDTEHSFTVRSIPRADIEFL